MSEQGVRSNVLLADPRRGALRSRPTNIRRCSIIGIGSVGSSRNSHSENGPLALEEGGWHSSRNSQQKGGDAWPS